jgi:hypothetical protein
MKLVTAHGQIHSFLQNVLRDTFVVSCNDGERHIRDDVQCRLKVGGAVQAASIFLVLDRCLLRRKDVESLLDRHALLRELVIRRETSWRQRQDNNKANSEQTVSIESPSASSHGDGSPRP